MWFAEFVGADVAEDGEGVLAGYEGGEVFFGAHCVRFCVLRFDVGCEWRAGGGWRLLTMIICGRLVPCPTF